MKEAKKEKRMPEKKKKTTKPVKAEVAKVIRRKAAVKKAPVQARPKITKPLRPKTKTVKKQEPVRHVTASEQVKSAAVPLHPPVLPIQAKTEIPLVKKKPKEIIEESPKKIQEVSCPTTPPEVPQVVSEAKALELKLPITVKDLAVKLQEKPSVLIKQLMGMRVMAGINNVLDEGTVTAICSKYGCTIKKAPDQEELALSVHVGLDAPEDLESRWPIVTLMGHVDHGKTSLLDAIRKSKVVDSEHGGITQHIGAYRVILPKGEITFLDTPGHEAFTAMRARGAKATDIVVLVVAADDGIMPQTAEAIDHARAAGVSIIVAINKIDKPQADVERVKKQLADTNLLSEDWGGKIITVPVSAKTGQGIDDLLEMILLEAQMLELKANPDRPAKGVVLEGKLVKNRGPVVTLLIQNGTLHLNEHVIVGKHYGKIKAMFNDHHQPVAFASPSYPVEVLGITGVPEAGEQFFVIQDEKTAKELSAKRQEQLRQNQLQPFKRIGLEDLYSQIKEGKIKELNLIIKADAQGSLEAIIEAINKLNVSEIKIIIIHQGAGAINSSDVMLAVASCALILGFNVNPDDPAKVLIEKEGQDVRTYNIIYDLVNDIKAALEGMLEPKLKKVFLGKAEIRKVFTLSKHGVIAGCMVIKGKITRNAKVDIIRNGSVVFEGALSSLKRFKDDVKEVEEGFECGMSIGSFDTIAEGDIVEAYQIEKIARKL
ncbi:MAG: translation initiation factor IF-2 [Candidatus Omnitrophota bacterium]|jgi:translation initiation factor IF-2|nr:MAG: translation initiation factor IF-2 [Candidatus Omnitrophota bacterium]